MKHIVEALLEYANFLGAKRINELPGLWKNKINDQWTIKCNGHIEDIEGVPAFSWYIEYDGCPAAILSIMGDGFIWVSDGLNEESLHKAIEGKMRLNYLRLLKNKIQNLGPKYKVKNANEKDVNHLRNFGETKTYAGY